MTTNPTTADGLVKNLRDAQRRVRSVLVANADRLNTPFTDDPGKNPWDTFVRPAMRELQDAVNAACEALTAVSPPPATDRAAVLREAAEVGEDVANRIHASGDDHRAGGAYDVVDGLRRVADEAQQPVCAECGHPHAAHREGDDPVTPGTCAGCGDDDRHDYEAAVEAQQQPDTETRCDHCKQPGHSFEDCPQAAAPAVVSQPGKET